MATQANYPALSAIFQWLDLSANQAAYPGASDLLIQYLGASNLLASTLASYTSNSQPGSREDGKVDWSPLATDTNGEMSAQNGQIQIGLGAVLQYAGIATGTATGRFVSALVEALAHELGHYSNFATDAHVTFLSGINRQYDAYAHKGIFDEGEAIYFNYQVAQQLPASLPHVGVAGLTLSQVATLGAQTSALNAETYAANVPYIRNFYYNYYGKSSGTPLPDTIINPQFRSLHWHRHSF